MDKLLEFLIKKLQKKNRNVVLDKKEQALFRVGREQFLQLKQKGIKIPIFTL